MGFLFSFLYFVVADHAVASFNNFFRDFLGFRDFQVFDLAYSKVVLTLS